ncbi:hypothetical protein B9Z19DRAFT_40887 [Tuber borchii]|uniref:Uncharacterized protein n=1 Tax=Tuber borchii TaxID=42251 RepID=A0A2T6ZT78_TUBBO|nr:hypothetical protein B9Z19DRAFT_40887 [Tuber borchii]
MAHKCQRKVVTINSAPQIPTAHISQNLTIHIQQLGHRSSNSEKGGGDDSQVPERSNRQFRAPRYPWLIFLKSLDFSQVDRYLSIYISPRWPFFFLKFVLLDLSLRSFYLPLNQRLAFRYFYLYGILACLPWIIAGDATAWCALLATTTRLADIPYIIVQLGNLPANLPHPDTPSSRTITLCHPGIRLKVS